MKSVSKFYAYSISILFLAGMISCCPCKKVKSFSMTGTEWTLMELNDVVVDRSADTESYTMLLDKDGRFSGKGDCNRYFGSYKMEKDGEISFDGIGSTRAMCPNQARESQYLKMLDEADKYKVDMNYLILMDDNNKIIASFKLKPSETVK